MASMEDFLTELLAPVSKTAAVRESATDPEDAAGAAVIREARASLRARHRRLTDAQTTYVIDRRRRIRRRPLQ